MSTIETPEEELTTDKDSVEYKAQVHISFTTNQAAMLRKMIRALARDKVATKKLLGEDVNPNLWRSLLRKLGV